MPCIHERPNGCALPQHCNHEETLEEPIHCTLGDFYEEAPAPRCKHHKTNQYGDYCDEGHAQTNRTVNCNPSMVRCYERMQGDPEQYPLGYNYPMMWFMSAWGDNYLIKYCYQNCHGCRNAIIYDGYEGQLCKDCQEGQRVAHEINHLLNYFVSCEKTTADDIKLWKKMQVHSWKKIPLTEKLEEGMWTGPLDKLINAPDGIYKPTGYLVIL